MGSSFFPSGGVFFSNLFTRFRFFLDFDLESFSVFVQPEECGLSRSEPEIGVREPMQCPIIANFTIGITPRGVADLSDRELRDVSGDDSIR